MVAKRFSLGTALVALALLAAGCSASPTPDGAPVDLVATFDQLVDALQAAGLPAEAAGTVSQPFFEPGGRVISLNREEIQVFQFESQVEAEAAAGTISADGTEIGTNMATWIAAPHFFQGGDLIVLYLGDQAVVVDALGALLGPQIAGG